MAAPISQSTPRAVVEHLVREQVYASMGLSLPAASKAPNALLVNISARHCHLTQAAVEALFGPGHQLTPMKGLYQNGQYAAKESITLIGPRSRIISNLRILGPCRDLNQVELAYTDAISLGFNIPLAMTFDKLIVRVDPSFKLEVHIDTDEGNACGLKPDTFCELIK